MNVSLTEYLLPNEWVDSDSPLIRSRAQALVNNAAAISENAERLYLFVRDEILHSWDAQRVEVNGKASEVLSGGHGICYGKSHLLAALLRTSGIPAGIAYQRLTLFDDPKDGFAIHVLNIIYLEDLGRWIRVDARGNKPGIDARFSPDKECLAFPIRESLGEQDYGVNHASPHPAIVRTLRINNDCRKMYQNGLPTELEYPT